MPPFAKTIGLILLAVDPLAGMAQSLHTGREPGVYRASYPVSPAVYSAPTPTAPQGLPPGNAPAASDAPYAVQQQPPRPVSTPATGTRLPRRLPPPKKTDASTGDRPISGLPSVVTVASSLAIVLGIFLLFAWAMRRTAPAGALALPGEVFEVLGSAPMAARQQAHLLRCGRKLVLVSVTTAGTETITEITDPEEVDRLAGLCRQAHPQSATATFRQVFKQFAQRNQPSDFFDHQSTRDARLSGPDTAASRDPREARNA